MSLEAALNPTRPKGENESHLLLLILSMAHTNSTEIPPQLHTHLMEKSVKGVRFFVYCTIHIAMD